jgi:hypothetical protein
MEGVRVRGDLLKQITTMGGKNTQTQPQKDIKIAKHNDN